MPHLLVQLHCYLQSCVHFKPINKRTISIWIKKRGLPLLQHYFIFVISLTRYQFCWNFWFMGFVYTDCLSVSQPRSQGFSLAPPTFKGKALGTRLSVSAISWRLRDKIIILTARRIAPDSSGSVMGRLGTILKWSLINSRSVSLCVRLRACMYYCEMF